MELKGYGSTVSWDGQTLTLTAKNKIAATKMNGKEMIGLTPDQVAGINLKPATFATNGLFTVHTTSGEVYEAVFLRKHGDGFVELAEQFDTAAPVVGFVGVTISAGHVSYQGQSYSLPAAARVETAGQIRERVTATRLVAVGIFAFAFKKKKDARELYLTVEGDGWGFVVDVDPKKGRQAREFAMKINNAR